MKKYNNLDKKIVYNFLLWQGGISDCIKFFMYVLEICIKHDYKLYYIINNLFIEKYIKLIYPNMYITVQTVKNNYKIIYDINYINDINSTIYNVVHPNIFYKVFNYDNITIPINKVFYFSDQVMLNSKLLFNVPNYIAVHLRLGDKHLEINKKLIQCYEDDRPFSEEKLYAFIEENYTKNILFICDNNSYKKKLKEKYSYIFITNCNIGHTALASTTDNQVLDTITEFYLLTKAEKIYSISESGFPIVASKFNNIPLITLY